MNTEPTRVIWQPAKRRGRLLVVLLGIILGQFILYGPSLVGKKILLPLDILALPNVYLPVTPKTRELTVQNTVLVDLVMQWEPIRQNAVSEFHAGRLPMWSPYQYTGAPVVWPKFSPFMLLKCSLASPVIIAWAQLCTALVAGLGMYLFCRRVLMTSFWAAAFPSWCYPLTGFFVFWQGFPTCWAVYWLPWLLVVIDRGVRHPGLLKTATVAVTTGVMLVSGAIDVAGQVLMIGGLYAIWRWLDEHRKSPFQWQATRAVFTIVCGTLLGILLATPYLLPSVEYAKTGARMERRGAGSEERPPTGLSALPQTVLPDIYGSSDSNSLRVVEHNQYESSAAIYTGVMATLLMAPLAWCSRRHRSLNIFWCGLILFGLSWCLDVPGIVNLLRLPGLNMMSHNRLVFASSFAVLAMTAIGLDALVRGEVRWQKWFWAPVAILAVLLTWCVFRAVILPDSIATKMETNAAQGLATYSAENIQRVQLWFTWAYFKGAVLCALTLIGWLLLWIRPELRQRALFAVGLFLVIDLLWFGYDRSPQCDPALYYPRIPALEAVAKSPPARVIGCGCLPAILAQTHDLRDVRGYDAIDPKRLLELIASARDPRTPNIRYAASQWFVPRVDLQPPAGVKLSPIFDLLNVGYVIFRGEPPVRIHPAIRSDDYWVLVNSNALPRAFVPVHATTLPDDGQCMERIAAPDFDPRQVAYTTAHVDLAGPCRGTVNIVSEISTRIDLSTKMETPGLVVLADLWDQGWHARLDGNAVPILRVDHALRGVVVPAGSSTLEFFYRPESLIRGLQLCAAAAGIIVILFALHFWRGKRPANSPPI